MALETPDYAVLCGRVEALLEGYFAAEDLKMQRYYLGELKKWLDGREAHRQRFNAEVEALSAKWREEARARQLARDGE